MTKINVPQQLVSAEKCDTINYAQKRASGRDTRSDVSRLSPKPRPNRLERAMGLDPELGFDQIGAALGVTSQRAQFLYHRAWRKILTALADEGRDVDALLALLPGEPAPPKTRKPTRQPAAREETCA